MINYVQQCAPWLSEWTAPIRDLLKVRESVHVMMCDKDVHGKCLQKIKEVLISTTEVKYFDPDKALLYNAVRPKMG